MGLGGKIWVGNEVGRDRGWMAIDGWWWMNSGG